MRRETLRPLRLALRRHVFWGMESRHAWPAERLVPAGQRIGSILARADGPADRPRGRTGPRVAGMWRSFASLFLTFIALGWATIISALCFFYGALWGDLFGREWAFYGALIAFVFCFLGARVLLRWADRLLEPYSGPFDARAYRDLAGDLLRRLAALRRGHRSQPALRLLRPHPAVG